METGGRLSKYGGTCSGLSSDDASSRMGASIDDMNYIFLQCNIHAVHTFNNNNNNNIYLDFISEIRS